MRYYDSFGFQPLAASSYRVTTVETPLITLDELKQHLGIFETDFDTHLTNIIIPTATQLVSNIMGEFGNDTTVAAYYPQFSNEMILPHIHVDSILNVQYYDSAHTLTNLVAGTDFVYDNTAQPPLVRLLTGSPELSDRFDNPVVINYLAFVDSTRYSQTAIVHATAMVAADLWYNRQNTTDRGRSAARATAERLLAPLKRVSL